MDKYEKVMMKLETHNLNNLHKIHNLIIDIFTNVDNQVWEIPFNVMIISENAQKFSIISETISKALENSPFFASEELFEKIISLMQRIDNKDTQSEAENQ